MILRAVAGGVWGGAVEVVLACDLIIATLNATFAMTAAKPMSPRGFEKVQGLRRVVYDSQDYHEGLRAFKEKRNPVFTGK